MLSFGGLTLLAALSGCGGQEEAAHNTAEHDMNMIMEATSPFADAEIRMNDAMMQAVGVNVGDNWVRKMIEHHKGAVEISLEVLKMKPDARLAEMARQTIDKQTRDIAALRKLVVQGRPDPASAELYQPTMDKMHQAMMAANGSRPSETYVRKMLEHHKGAVAMSDVALKNGVSGAVRAEVEKTKEMNEDDAKMAEAMLRGEPMREAKTDASSSKPAERRSSTGSTASKGMPAPGTNTPEHEAQDMNSMNHM